MISELFTSILDALFPKTTNIVELELLTTKGKLFNLPKAPQTPKPWMNSLFAYKNKTVRDIVWQIKYVGNTKLLKAITEVLSEEILAYFEEQSEFAQGEWLIVPVPASPSHKREKGFNQTEELAQELMKTLLKHSVSYIPNVLSKIRETKPQAEIKNRSARLQNLIGAFTVTDPSIVKRKRIIVIDDVLTTGSTVTEAKRALIEAGAREVVAFTVAH